MLQEFHFEATVVLTGFKIDGKGNFDVGTVGEADGIGRQVISALPRRVCRDPRAGARFSFIL